MELSISILACDNVVVSIIFLCKLTYTDDRVRVTKHGCVYWYSNNGVRNEQTISSSAVHAPQKTPWTSKIVAQARTVLCALVGFGLFEFLFWSKNGYMWHYVHTPFPTHRVTSSLSTSSIFLHGFPLILGQSFRPYTIFKRLIYDHFMNLYQIHFHRPCYQY